MSRFLSSPKIIETIATSNSLNYEEVASLASVGFDAFIKAFDMNFTDQVIALMDEAMALANNLKVGSKSDSWVVPFSKCPPISKLAELSEALDSSAYYVKNGKSNLETLLPNWEVEISGEMRKTREHSLPLFIYNLGVEYERRNESLPGNLTIIEMVSAMLPFYNCQVWGGLFLKEEEFSYELWEYLYSAFHSLR
jgi:hypothetical protein